MLITANIFFSNIMDEIAPPETRGRSRSKTPFVLRSSCDKANCTEGAHGHEPVKRPQTVK